MSSPSEKDIEKAREIIASTCLKRHGYESWRDPTRPSDDALLVAQGIAAARAEGRREGMEAACKLVCDWCRQQIPLRGHAHDFGDGRLAGCDASAIRRAMEEPDEQSE